MPSEARAHAFRTQHSELALHGMYELTKLMAGRPRDREGLAEVLQMLCHCFELADAAIALRSADGGAELIAPRHPDGCPNGLMRTLLFEALRRSSHFAVPWVVESQWEEPSLQRHMAPQDMHDLDLSFVTVPIQRCQRLLGVLCIERCHGPCDQQEFCFDDDVRTLSMVANLIAATDQGESPELRREWEPRDVGRDPSRQLAPTPDPQYDNELDAAAASVGALGDSGRWRATLDRARAAARHSTTVLLRGESGTGKEVVARMIHAASRRRDQPFVSLNCAALSESILSSELFGHEKGAFTGALTRRKGRFELADGGTLFLDEIGEIPATFQAALLRVLQLGEFERVGGTQTVKVDVRIIAATNRDLEHAIRTGVFRADLYYRISVLPLYLPPLRDRPADIPLLGKEFLRRFNEANDTQLRMDSGALAVLSRYSFPGNVRELENAIYRAATLSTRQRLTREDFSFLEVAQATEVSAPRARPARVELCATTVGRERDDNAHAPDELDFSPMDESVYAPTKSGACGPMDDARARLLETMERAGWVQAKAARLLGLTPRQVAYALQKHQIPIRKF